jgi:hypothetical protein
MEEAYHTLKNYSTGVIKKPRDSSRGQDNSVTRDYRVPFLQRKGEPPPLLRDLRLFFRAFPSVLEHIPPRSAKDLSPLTFIFEDETACIFFYFEYFPEIRRPVPEDFADTGLTLVIELARPPFFPIVAFDAAAKLAHKFNLFLLLPGSTKPSVPQKEQFISHYEKENLKAVEKARKRGEIIPYLPKEQLLYWWKYASNLPSLQKTFQSVPIALPLLTILQYKNTSKAVTAFPWIRMRPAIFPQTDYVIVERAWHPPQKISYQQAQIPGKREKVEVGLALFSEVMEIVRPYVQSRKEPLPFFIYRVTLTPPDLRESIRKLRLTDLRAYKSIRPDSVVEFPPLAP